MKGIQLTSFNRTIKWARALSLSGLFVIAMAGANPVIAQDLSPDQIAKLQAAFSAGVSFMGSGNVEKGAEKFTEAIAIAPSFPLPYVNRGVAYLSLGKSSEAMADAEKGLSLLESGSASALMNSSDIPNYLAVAYQVKGSVLQNRKDYLPSIEAFNKSIELVPNEAKFLNNRGNTYRLMTDYEAALRDYDKAIELDKSIVLIFINRGWVYLKLKKFDAALRDLDHAVGMDKANDSAYYARANTYVELKKYPEASADFDQAIALKRKSEFFHGRARMHFLQGKFDLAVKDHTEAILLDPSNANAFGDRAVAYERLAKHALAVDDVRKALELKGESVLMRYTLAYLLFKTGKFSIALPEATRVAAMAPKWRDAYILRANIYSKLANPAKAKADMDAAGKLTTVGRPVEDITLFDIDIFLPEDIDN